MYGHSLLPTWHGTRNNVFQLGERLPEQSTYSTRTPQLYCWSWKGCVCLLKHLSQGVVWQNRDWISLMPVLLRKDSLQHEVSRIGHILLIPLLGIQLLGLDLVGDCIRIMTYTSNLYTLHIWNMGEKIYPKSTTLYLSQLPLKWMGHHCGKSVFNT